MGLVAWARMIVAQETLHSGFAQTLDMIAFCAGIHEGPDWEGIVRLAKVRCWDPETVDETRDIVPSFKARIACDNEVMDLSVQAARQVLEDSGCN